MYKIIFKNCRTNEIKTPLILFYFGVGKYEPNNTTNFVSC